MSALKAIVQGLRGVEEEEEDEEDEEGEESTVVEDIDVDYEEGGASTDAAVAVAASTEGRVVMGHLVEGHLVEVYLVEGQQPDLIAKKPSPSSSSPRKSVAAAMPPAVLPPPVAAVKLEDLQPVFVPDRGGVLHASSFLTVDDAPWISGNCCD